MSATPSSSDPNGRTPAMSSTWRILVADPPLGYRAEEVQMVARRLLGDALGHWTARQGFGFQAPATAAVPPRPLDYRAPRCGWP